MKKIIAVMLIGSALAGPVAFADMNQGMSKDSSMCTKHCNLMDLQKKVDSLKSQENSADKTATKEHLRKDIETYEKKLEQMKSELDATR